MKIKKFVFWISQPVNLALLTSPVLAQDFETSARLGKPEPVKVTSWSKMINGVVRFVFYVAVLLTFFYLLWGGLQWITSGGDKEKYEEARSKITAALIGLAIIALAWLITQVVVWFFGLPNIWSTGGEEITLPRAID